MVSNGAVAIRLIGPFTIEAAGTHVAEAALPSLASAVVKLLVLEPSRTLPCDRLIETLWPDANRDRGRNNLHKTLHASTQSDLDVHRAGLH